MNLNKNLFPFEEKSALLRVISNETEKKSNTQTN